MSMPAKTTDASRRLILCIMVHAMFILPLTIFAPLPVRAQCDKCMDRIIYMFDAKINVPRPVADADSILKWWNLFTPACFARAWSHEEDPDKDCFTWIDGGMWLASQLQGGHFKFGPTYANVPPDGPVKGVPYIMTGFVNPATGPNLYTFTWEIECGTTREVVQSATVTFSTDSVDVTNAGKEAATELMPIETTIRAFEEKKRESDPGIARGGDEAFLRVTPARRQLKAHDTTTVELEMVDCDGYQLKNRQIVLHAFSDSTLGSFPGTVGGTVSPDVVTTDNEGKAQVTFTAGDNPGVAMVNAAYVFRKPHGWPFALIGNAVINLKANMWEVTAAYRSNSTTNHDTTYDDGHVVETDQAHSFVSSTSDWHFIYEVTDSTESGPENLNLSATPDSSEGIVYGLSSRASSQSISSNTMYANNYEEGYTVSQGTAFSESGSIGDSSSIYGGTYINLDRSGDYGVFQIGATVHEVGWRNEWLQTNPEVDGSCYDSPSNVDQWSTVIYEAMGLDASGASFTASDSGFHFTYFRSVNSGNGSVGTETIDASFVHLPDATDVHETNHAGPPREFMLYQNYPNPFNPTTIINYHLPMTCRVTLKVYDVLGREVGNLVNKPESAGNHVVTFNAGNLPCGIYFYRLRAGTYCQTKKLVLIK